MIVRPDFQVYVIPTSVAFCHGMLSVFGLSQGLEYYFWIAAMVIGAIMLGIRKQKNLLIHSVLIGLLIAAATGIPQAIFIDTYFDNNPEYRAYAEELSLEPQTYTLAMIPVIGTVIGLIIAPMGWAISKLKAKQ